MTEGLLAQLGRGALVTLALSVLGFACAICIAAGAGLGLSFGPRWLRSALRSYVELFRGTSLLVQLFWIYFALPMLGVRVGAFTAGVLVLSLNGGAYGAEIVRGALAAVPATQAEAAIALNLSPRDRVLRVVFPQAIPAMLPPLSNLAIELLKGSALASLVTIRDLTFAGQLARGAGHSTAVVFSLLVAFYFAIAQGYQWGFRRLERWTQPLGGGGSPP